MNINAAHAAHAALVNTASAATPGTVQGSAALSVLKKSMEAQQNAAAQLIAALPQPALATSGGVGTLVNTYA